MITWAAVLTPPPLWSHWALLPVWPSAAAETAGWESEPNPPSRSTRHPAAASAAPPSMTTARQADGRTDRQVRDQLTELLIFASEETRSLLKVCVVFGEVVGLLTVLCCVVVGLFVSPTSLVCVWKDTDMSSSSFLCSTRRTKSWIRTSRCRAAL